MPVVLIVEDNRSNMLLAADLLEGAGFSVLEATNADDGIAVARRALPDVIVMDIQLPGTDGLTATRLLKSDPLTRDIPVVAVTAHAMRGDEARILAAGCDCYVSKPIRYAEFVERVREAAAACLAPPPP